MADLGPGDVAHIVIPPETDELMVLVTLRMKRAWLMRRVEFNDGRFVAVSEPFAIGDRTCKLVRRIYDNRTRPRIGDDRSVDPLGAA